MSSRDEKIVYGGGGLHMELSQESSSFPTPPEMKSMDLDAVEYDIKQEPSERPALSNPEEEEDTEMHGVELPSDLSPIEISPLKPPAKAVVTGLELQIPTKQHDVDQSTDLRGNLSPLNNNSLPPPDDSVNSPKIAMENKAAMAAAHNAAILANPSLRSSTVVNPEFLKSYFDQSRLHHLSTWKADLKTQMQQLTSQNPRRLKKLGQRWIMHVDFDCFFCSVSLVCRPELKEKTVCVGHGGARSGEISSCNYPAREFGIHNGMR